MSKTIQSEQNFTVVHKIIINGTFLLQSIELTFQLKSWKNYFKIQAGAEKGQAQNQVRT